MIVGLAVDEILGLRPFLPAVDTTDLEDGRRSAWNYRTMLEGKALSGYAF